LPADLQIQATSHRQAARSHAPAVVPVSRQEALLLEAQIDAQLPAGAILAQHALLAAAAGAGSSSSSNGEAGDWKRMVEAQFASLDTLLQQASTQVRGCRQCRRLRSSDQQGLGAGRRH
jgi:hypothetical protein